MNYYSAKDLVEELNKEKDREITLRKVRYYTQIGILSPLVLVNGKQKYTGKHLKELRAIGTLQKTGEKLDDIKEKIKNLNLNDLTSISEQSGYITSERVMDTIVEYIDEDVSVTFSKNIDKEKKKEIINALKTISKNRGK